MKKWLAMAFAALFVMTAFTGCGQGPATSSTTSTNGSSATGDQSLATVMSKGQLVLGLDDSFPPMGYRDESNNIVGYDIDLATEVCARMGVKLVVQPIDWNSKEQELNGGNIDCIWNGMTITDERQAAMNMSAPYMRNRQVIVVLANSGLNTLADLSGKDLVLQAGSSAQDALDAATDFKATLGNVTSVDNNVTAMMELGQGTGTAVLMDEVVAKYYIAHMQDGSKYKLLEESLADEEYGIGFRKADQALRDKVQQTLGEMKADGKLAEITTKWFGADISVVPANA